MKSRTKYLIGAGAILTIVLAGSAMKLQPEFLKGSFGTGAPTVRLAEVSPSGATSVKTDDRVFSFTITAPEGRGIKFEEGAHFDFTFSSPTFDINAIDPMGSQVLLRSYGEGYVVGEGYIVTNDRAENPTEAWASVYFQNGVWSPIETTIEAGETMVFTLTIDSSELILEDAGEDDQLDVSMEYNGRTVVGNTLQY